MPRASQLTALLIAPNRELAQAFVRAQNSVGAFHILSELKSFLTDDALGLRLRQLQPDVVLLDLSSGLEQALNTLRAIQSYPEKIHVVGIHTCNDSDALLRSFRAGAAEFLYAPFDPETILSSHGRIQKLISPELSFSDAEFAFVIGFTSPKPGSGASTLAAQTAFSLRRSGKGKILLIDLDLMGGTAGFYFKIQSHGSIVTLLEQNTCLDASIWSTAVEGSSGIDIMPSPDEPSSIQLDQSRLHDILEFARRKYDWIILDMPSVFDKTTLLGMPEADMTLLVSTSELPSLHLTRKAIGMVQQLGFDQNRYQVVVNRLDKRDGISAGDMEKMFNARLFATVPNDYFSLHRVVTLGEPLGKETDLGKSIDSFSAKLIALANAVQKPVGNVVAATGKGGLS